MKLRFGLLMAGASAIALAGCHTGGGFDGNALAILGSGAVNTTTHATTSVSDASSDTLTDAKITYTDNGAAGPSATDTVTVEVKNGDAVGGPTTYTQDSAGQNYIVDSDGIGPTGIVANTSNSGYSAFGDFIPTPTSATQDSILIAATGDYSFAGFVGANSTSDGTGNIAAGFGGDAPTGLMPSGNVAYHGNAAATVQTVGQLSTFRGGASTVDANFTSGAVSGLLDFTGSGISDITFAGQMDSDKATYAANSVTYNGIAATGQLQGGFYGPGYAETAGAFDVQDVSTGTKVTGSFGGSLP